MSTRLLLVLQQLVKSNRLEVGYSELIHLVRPISLRSSKDKKSPFRESFRVAISLEYVESRIDLDTTRAPARLRITSLGATFYSAFTGTLGTKRARRHRVDGPLRDPDYVVLSTTVKSIQEKLADDNNMRAEALPADRLPQMIRSYFDRELFLRDENAELGNHILTLSWEIDALRRQRAG
ncbi:hypothetical protein GY45DRAFT_1376199 [Cubamyces sp. BRFM 1775]|nr:hypothetical protein GY45DRAFT_1376199 [Cubamyces sp. BRFM 1775]